MMFYYSVLICAFCLHVSPVYTKTLGEPATHYYEKCNQSLLREEFMDTLKPVKQAYVEEHTNNTAYLSHIKNIYPFWCVSVRRQSYRIWFTFNEDMFITGLTTKGDIDRDFESVEIGYTSDHLFKWNTKKMDYYTEDITTGEAKSFEVGSGTKIHKLLFPFTARSVLFELKQSSSDVNCVRLDILGCFANKLYCNDGSATFGGHCYSGNSLPQFTQEEAEVKCAEEDSEILIVDSYAEARFLEGLIPYGYWLGLRRNENLEFIYESDFGTPYFFSWEGLTPVTSEQRRYDNYVTYMATGSFKWHETLKTDAHNSIGFFCIGKPDTDGECPQQNSTLFNGYCYSYFNSSFVHHSLAYYNCWIKDMWIGIIHNKHANNFIKELLPTSPWTGVRKNVNGTFMYGNGTYELREKGWTYWTRDSVTEKNEPGIYEYEMDCVFIDGSYDVDNNWMDSKCTQSYWVTCQQEKINGSCTEGWVDMLNDTFCYLNLPDKLPQTFARTVCGQLEGELLMFYTNQTHYKFAEVISMWNRTWIGDTGDIVQPLSIGMVSALSDLEAEGGYSNWLPGQDIADAANQCVVSAGAEGQWEAVNCSESRLYLCEKDPGTVDSAPIAQISTLSVEVIKVGSDTIVRVPSDSAVTDMPGYDEMTGMYCTDGPILQLISTNVSECLGVCEEEVNCYLAMYNQSVTESDNCWLIKTCYNISPNMPSFTSYVKRSHTEIDNYVAYPSTDCEGNNIGGTLVADTAVECAGLCSENDDCVAIVYVSSGTNCYLKSVCDHFVTKVPITSYRKILETETVTLATVYGLWPLDSVFHGLELTEQCEHADLIGVTVQDDSDEGLTLSGLYGERIEVPIPSFLKEPVERFSMVISLRWQSLASTTGTLFGFGYQEVSDDLLLQNRTYSFSVSLIEAAGSFNTSSTTGVTKALQVFTGEQVFKSDKIHIDTGIWYTIGVIFDEGDLKLYFNDTNILIEDISSRTFISDYLSDNSKLLIGSSIQMDVHCLQIYREVLTVEELSVAVPHRCTSAVSPSNIKTTTICYDKVGVMSCREGSSLNIIQAKFGRNLPYSSGVCSVSPDSSQFVSHCNVDMTPTLQRICRGKSRCLPVYSDYREDIDWDNYPCDPDLMGAYYLNIHWTCMPTVPCDDSWWYEANKCYTWSIVPGTMEEAVDYCGQMNAWLPIINSSDTQNAVKDFLFYQKWLSLQDVEEEGTFLWENGEEPAETHWVEGYPVQQYLVENCTQLVYDEGQLTHNDIFCHYERSYMCKHRYEAVMCDKYVLEIGETLETGERLCSEDGKHTLVLQEDGNLVVKDGDTVTFATGTTTGRSLSMSSNGDLQLMGTSGLMTLFSGDGGRYVKISHRGYLAVYTAFDNILWTANNQDCYRTHYGYDYMGTRDVSSTGTPCKQWSNDTGNEVSEREGNFPDTSLEEAGSFCRNPFIQDQPGCVPAYASEIQSTNIETCDISTCEEGYDGFEHSEDNCRSIFDNVDASAAISYEPGYEYYDAPPHLAVNILVDTVDIIGEQVGGACLHDKENSGYPGSIQVILNGTERISGIVVQQTSGNSNKLKWKSKINIYYSSDGRNWTKFVDADLTSSFGPYGIGRHIFAQPFDTSYLKIALNNDEQLECFRMDLLSCNANVIYKEIAVNYRTAIVEAREIVVDSNTLHQANDNLIYVSPYLTEDPFLYLELSDEQYILEINVIYPNIDDLINTTYKIYLPEERPNITSVASDGDLCTDVKISTVAGEHSYRCRILTSTKYILFKASGYSTMAFDQIVIFIPKDTLELEDSFQHQTSAAESILDNVASGGNSNISDASVEAKNKELRFMEKLDLEEDMASTVFDGSIGKDWKTVLYKKDLISGVLNDGLLLNDLCLHIKEQELPALYITLEKGMFIAEIRITSPSVEPYDSLVNLTISLGKGLTKTQLVRSSEHSNAFIKYKEGNCVTNHQAFSPGETRSFFCPGTSLADTVVIYKNELDSLRVCEVEVYRATDKTDIPRPTYESEWLKLEDSLANEMLAYNHTLGVTPVYGRILLKTKHLDDDGGVYFTYQSNILSSAEEFSLSGHIYLSYNADQYIVWSDGIWDPETTDFLCANESWTTSVCLLNSDALFKVQLWTQCGFPLASFMSPWESNIDQNMTYMVIPHHLGKSASFGYVQLEHDITLQQQPVPFLWQVHGFPAEINSTQAEVSGMFFNDTSVTLLLNIDKTVSRYRVLLWYTLSNTPPVYKETFETKDFVGPEKLQLPPYAIENSIITIVVAMKLHNNTYHTSAPFVGFGGLMFAFSSQYLRLNWLHDQIFNNTEDMELTSMTVSVYRLGADILSNAYCEPYTGVGTNLFLDCGNWKAASGICEETESQQGTSSTVLVTCSPETNTWSNGQCVSADNTGEAFDWMELAGHRDGYQYMKHSEPLRYEDGVELCKEQGAKMLTLPTLNMTENLFMALTMSGLSEGSIYLDGPGMLPFVNVFDIEETLGEVLKYNTSHETLNYTGVTTYQDWKCLVLVFDQIMYTFNVSYCTAHHTIVCRKPVCQARNKFRFVPYKYRKTDPSDKPYEVAILPESCLSYCFDRFDCKSMEYNSVSMECRLFDYEVSVAGNPNTTDFYGESIIYRKECKTVHEPPWEVFFAINTTSLQNGSMGISSYLFDMDHTDDEDVYPYILRDRTYTKTNRSYYNYIFQLKVSLIDGGEEVAFVSIPTFGRALPADVLPFDTFIVSSASLNLTSSDLYPLFLFSSCKPNEGNLSSRNLIIYDSEFCSENGTVLTEYPMNPKALYRDRETGTFKSSELVVISVNSFCWVKASVDTKATGMSESHKIRIANTNMFQFKFQQKCQGAEITLYDNTKPWQYDMYSIKFYTEVIYKIKVYNKGNVKIKNFNIETLRCEAQIYWIRWIAGLLEIGVILADDQSITLVQYETGANIEPNDLSIQEAEVYLPRESYCPPLVLANTTEKVIQSSLGTCSRKVYCMYGYELEDGQEEYSTYCNDHGFWNRVKDCQKKMCNETSFPNSNQINVTASFNETLTVVCDEDHFAFGNENISSYVTVCNGSRHFDIIEPCLRLPCQYLTIEHSNVSSVEAEYLEQVVVGCDEGFETEDGEHAYAANCLSNRTWSPIFHCQRKKCPLLNLANSNITNHTAYHEDNITVTCDPGYAVNQSCSWDGQDNITCEDEFVMVCEAGEWNHFNTCATTACPPLYIDHSNALGINGSVGDYFMVSCDYGYEGIDDRSPLFKGVCDVNGQWSNIQNCTRVKCFNISRPTGVYVVNTSFSYGVYEDKVLYGCATGYSSIEGLYGPWSICEGNGSWTSAPHCHVDCNVREVITDPEASLSHKSIHIRYGESINVTCPDGLKPKNNSLYCTEDGQWLAAEASCIDLDCGQPPSSPGTDVVWTTANYTSEAVYTCSGGFSEMAGNGTSLCGLDEEWTTPPICYRDCGPLPEQAYGYLSTNETHYKTVVTVTCLNSTFYVNNSVAAVECMSDGNWSDTIGHCIFAPVDGEWLPWTPWSGCAASCGNFERSRTRECSPPLYGGQTCPGSTNASESCELPPCTADGYWTTWTSWTDCSVSCSGGTQARKRECIGPYGSGQPCDGEHNRTRICSDIQCPKVSCTKPPHVANAVQLGNSQFVGSVVVYLCQDKDMEFADGTQETFIRCTNFGTWLPNSVPACESVKCPEQILPQSTLRSTKLRYLGTLVEYSCLTGYHFKDETDKSSSYCNLDRTWSHDPPECVAKTCENLVSGALTSETSKRVTYGEHVMVSCEEGARLRDGRGEHTEECGAKRVVSDICSETHCPPIPLVSNASVIHFNQSMVTFECFRGHRFPDGYKLQSLMCTNESLWEPEYIQGCLVITCPPVPEVINASPNDTNAIYGTRVMIQCEAGYQFEVDVTSMIIECTDIGQWDEEPTKCLEVVCGIPPFVGNATRKYTNISLDDMAEYICLAYHRFSNGHDQLNISCTANSSWQHIDTACSLERCEPVPVSANARSNTDSAVIDTTAIISCHLGYTLPVEMTEPQTTTCERETKLWSNIPVDCIPVTCPVLAPNDHVVLSTSDRDFSTEVNVTCEAGYWFEPETAGNESHELVPVTISCLHNETWNDSITDLHCHRLECPRVFEVAHARINSSSHYAGESVLYTCVHGFHFPDTELEHRAITCMDNGVWNEQLDINCEIKQCPPLAVWNHMTVNTTETVYSTVVKLECSPGYTFIGTTNTTIVTECGSDKLWQPEAPVCSVPENKTEPVPVEAENSSAIGAGIMITLLTLLGLVIVTDIVTYYQQAISLLKTNIYPNIKWMKQHLTMKVSPGKVSENPGSEYAEISNDPPSTATSVSDLSRPMSSVSKDSTTSPRSDTPISARAIQIHGLTVGSLACIEECVTPDIGLKGPKAVDKIPDDFSLEFETSFVHDIPNPDCVTPPNDQYSDDFDMSDSEQEDLDEPVSIDINQANPEQYNSPEPPTCVEDPEGGDTKPEELEEPETCEEPVIEDALNAEILQEEDNISFSQEMEEPGSVDNDLSSANLDDQGTSSEQVKENVDDDEETDYQAGPESVGGNLDHLSDTHMADPDLYGSPSSIQDTFNNECSQPSPDGDFNNQELDDDKQMTVGAPLSVGLNDPPNVSMSDNVSSPGEVGDIDRQLHQEISSRASSGYNSAQGSFMEEQDLD